MHQQQFFRQIAHVGIALLGLVVAPAAGWTRDADDDAEISIDEIIVTATRTPTLIRDEPLRVEAVPAEEIEENQTIQPGNLASLFNELPGIRVQSEAPGLGGAGLQLRGMPARHTLVLADGLPLLGAEPDVFGLLQIPPIDLARVEVIKGATSALYGGSALGGVLNLVSQSPAAEPVVLANVGSRGARDLVGFITSEGSRGWSGTLTVGAHVQSRRDVSGGGWAEVVGYRRYTLQPRIWWQGDQDHSLFLTAGVVDDERKGGTMPGSVLPKGSVFAEALRTRRFNGGVVTHWALSSAFSWNGRLSLTANRLDRAFDTSRIASTQSTAFAESTLLGAARGHSWVLGMAFEHDSLAAPTVPGVSHSYNLPAVFLQDEFRPAPWLKLAASARVDAHDQLGTFFSTRLSALLRRPEGRWSLRASIGNGFAAPTPWMDDVAATDLGTLLPLQGLHAERAVTESLDAKWSDDGWDVNLSVFNSVIRDPLISQSAAGNRIRLLNAPGPRRAPGAEIVVRNVTGLLQILGSWSYIDASETSLSGQRQQVSLVPRHSAELAGIIESEKRGRIGLELAYTGSQTLVDNPYRSVSKPYYELNALGELRIGTVAIFLNAINLTDVRQTHYDPLTRPTAGVGGNPITEAWAPLAGRTFNLGVRAEL